jgi:UDP-N-acetylmuramate dehydrogenase
VGGGIKMNAGAFGGEMSRQIVYVDVLREGRKLRLPMEECGFHYRGSGFFPSDVILGGLFRSEKESQTEIAKKRAEYSEKRNASQPRGFCCGSVFKAADKPAWEYIKGCGLSGKAVGDAEISTKHANFIMNRGFASAKDVLTLIKTAKAEVYAKYRVKLKEEIIFAGDF